MIPDWTQAEPFDVVVLCLAAGLAVLILAAVVLDWIRHRRLVRFMAIRADFAALVKAQIEADDVTGDNAERRL